MTETVFSRDLICIIQNNAIGYEEFIAAFIGEMSETRSALVRKAWRKMDAKGNGNCNINDARKVIKSVSKNYSKKILKNYFKKLMI